MEFNLWGGCTLHRNWARALQLPERSRSSAGKHPVSEGTNVYKSYFKLYYYFFFHLRSRQIKKALTNYFNWTSLCCFPWELHCSCLSSIPAGWGMGNHYKMLFSPEQDLLLQLPLWRWGTIGNRCTVHCITCFEPKEFKEDNLHQIHRKKTIPIHSYFFLIAEGNISWSPLKQIPL